jgi:7-cyano-7-deazaguanine synthase in queuosine biosynthesis
MIFETVYKCENSDNRVIIPLDSEWENLAIQLSGGVDSALLTYLTAMTIKEHGLKTKIRTLSCDVGNKPDYLPTARRVREKLKELTPWFNQWAEPYEYKIPLRESKNPMKLYASVNHIKALMAVKHIDYEYNGVTKNPPDDERTDFFDDEYRQTVRDNPESIYSGPRSARPLAFCDKRGVVELYKKYGLIESLFTLTLSCDVNKENIVDGKIPCGNCWWCSERQWGLRVNGLDPSL